MSNIYYVIRNVFLAVFFLFLIFSACYSLFDGGPNSKCFAYTLGFGFVIACFMEKLERKTGKRL